MGKSLVKLFISNTEKQFQWKVIHNAIFTENKLFLMNMSTGLCHFCKTNTETIKHFFYECSLINSVIHKIENKIKCILGNDLQLKISLLSTHLVLGLLHENSLVRKFVNFIIILSKWEIWKLRNNVKFNNKHYSFLQIIDSMIQKLHTATIFLGNTSVGKKYEKELVLWKKI